jgi:LmbE family N-acetylglucosaminyl deacetylase
MFPIETLASAERVLAIGAHPDDIEIGCGGTLLGLRRINPAVDIRWLVLTGDDERAAEARASARRYLGESGGLTQHRFRDGYLPYADPQAVKEAVAAHREEFSPDLVLAPRTDDAHQDHSYAGRLVAQLYRHQIIAHYEIPKYDGDLGVVNVFVALDTTDVTAKIENLLAAFPSQAGRPWFDEATFRAIMRLRGVESRAASGYAEGFVAPKIVFG